MKKLLLISCLLVFSRAHSQIPTSGLTGEYLFSNGYLSNTAEDGVLIQTGSALSIEANRSGGDMRAISLNGDHLQRANNTSGNQDLSVSFWIKTSTNDATKRVIIDQTERTAETEIGSQTGWYAYLKDGKVGVSGNFQWAKQVLNIVSGSVFESTGYTGYLETNSSVIIADGNWHHITITIFTNNGIRQGTAIRATYNVYVDNVLSATQNQTYVAPDHPWSVVKRFVNLTHPITIGNSKDGNSTNLFQESIDDIRFYDRTIDASEVASLYNETACGGSVAATALTKDITVQLDATGNASISPDEINDGSTDSCGDLIANFSLDVSSFTCDDLGANTVTLTATDIEGNEAIATATVTVIPSITLALKSGTVIVDLDATGNLTLQPEDVDDGTFSSCGEALDFSLDRTDFTCVDAGSNIVVTITVTDAFGNEEMGTAMVRAEDSQDPIAIAQDVSVQLDATTGLATITTGLVDNGSSDNCVANLSLSQTQFTCDDLGENTVTLTASDNRGNTTTATAIVTVTSVINDEAVTAANASFCPDGTGGTTISTESSVVGVDYFLRNSEDNSIVHGPITGTGGALDFSTGNLSETATFNVFARIPTPSQATGALDFDGVNDYVHAGTSDRSISTQITVAARIKTAKAGSYNVITSKYDGTRGFLLYVDANGKAKLDGRDASGVYKTSGSSTVSVNDNQWHHLVATIDVTSGIWNIYVDGVLENSTNPGTGTSLLATSKKFSIGSLDNDYFTGQIGEVALWNVALNQAAIESNSCLTETESGLVAYFDFNDGAGSIAADKSPNAEDGNLISMDSNTDWIAGPLVSCWNGCGFEMSTEITIGDNTTPTVLTKNLTVQIDESGNVTIDPININNGSNDNCTASENLLYSLDQSTFDCSDLGENIVTLTVTDENGNEAAGTATITITSGIDEKAVSTTSNSVCPGSSATISLADSQTGVNYFLRNESEVVIEGPVEGNNGIIDFNTGPVTSQTNYNIYAELIPSVDNALKVAGNSGYVEIPSSASLQLAENWTIEAWVKPTGTVLNIVETYNANGGFILRTDGSKWQAFAMQSSSNFSIVTSVTSLEIDEWTHVAATFNETTNQLKMYVNGVLDATNSSATIDQRGSTTTIKLGARGDDNALQGEQTQDEVRIWNVERTAQEILEGKSVSLNGDETGLMAYYDFDDLTFIASEMIIEDRSSNGNDGTMLGTYSESNFIDGPLSSQSTCGIQMTQTVTITPEDNDAPVAIAQNFTARLDINNQVTVSPEDIDNGSFDECGSVSLQIELDNGSDLMNGSQTLTVVTEGLVFNETNLGANAVNLIVEDESGNISSTSATVTILEYKLAQTTSFEAITNKVYGDGSFDLVATASSGLAVSFAIIDGPASLSGNTVTITGAGTVTIEANQAGDDQYAPAEVAQQTFSVGKATLQVTADNRTITYGDAFPTLTFTYSGFVNGEDATDLISEPSISTSIGTAEGLPNAGTYSIILNGGESNNYELTLIEGTLVIAKANQIITIQPIEDKEPASGSFDVVASVDSDLLLTYAITGPATLSGSTIILDGTEGEVIVTVSQVGDINHNATSAEESFRVAKPLAIGDKLLDRVKIYPNPVVSKLMIEAGREISVKMFSLDGKLVGSATQVNGEFDLSGLKPGTYLLEISDGSEKFTSRIIKTN